MSRLTCLFLASSNSFACWLAGTNKYAINLQHDSAGAFTDISSSVNMGFSVRLLYYGTGTPSSTLTDYDGNVYDVVNIGTQYWTKQNWKCLHYNDGTDIPVVTGDSAWAALTSGACCSYNNDDSNV